MDNIQRYVTQTTTRVMFRAGVPPQACELSIRAVRPSPRPTGRVGEEPGNSIARQEKCRGDGYKIKLNLELGV